MSWTTESISVRSLALAVLLSACSLNHQSDGSVDARSDATDAVADSADGGACPAVDFVAPAQGAVLGPAQDVDRSCGNGFQYDVQLTTNAAVGTRLALLVNGMQRATATVAGSTVTFAGVSFDTRGMATLQVRLEGGSVDCGAPRVFTVDCNTPTCAITEPVRTLLNATDNESSMPTRFATHFLIQTDIEDGQSVVLELSPGLPITAQAVAGSARFAGVVLSPDGAFQVRARCTNRAGTAGQSATTTYTVDTAPPTLTASSPMPGTIVPFGAADTNATVPGKQFQVCARSDAAGQTLTAVIAGATPNPIGTTTVPASAMQDACVEITCPTGSAPFDVQCSVSDAAGNRTTATIAGVSCASTMPSVRIVDPVSSVMGTASTYLNASRDANAAQLGLQYDIVVCADRDVGMATLRINGAASGTPVALAAASAACAAAGLRGAAVFRGVTLPESVPVVNSPAGTIPFNPAIEVSVTDAIGDVGVSPGVTVFVDSVAPVQALFAPVCGSMVAPGTTGSASVDLRFSATDVPLTLTLQQGTSTPIVSTGNAFTSFGQVDFLATTLAPGTWSVTAQATDMAGNVSTSASCLLIVGTPPTLSFVQPTNGQLYSAVGDTAPTMPGYQGAMIRLGTDAPDGTSVALTIGAASPLTGTVSGGAVVFSSVTLPESNTLVLRADLTVAGRGNATASINVVVDTAVPGVASAISATVTQRRAGRIRVDWTGASDPDPTGGTRAVANYEVRWSPAPITTASAFVAATAVPYAATPGAPGSAESATATGLELGIAGSSSYYFAVRAVDLGGNTGPILSTMSATALDLAASRIVDVAMSTMGADVSGGADVNGDAFPDVVVGSWAGQARIYFGSATGLSLANSTLIQGVTDIGFGDVVVNMGDANGDGLGDIAVGASLSTERTYVFFGRRDGTAGAFPRAAALTIANADVVITGTGEFGTGSSLGASLAAADVNGDGLADLVIAASSAATMPAGSTTPVTSAGAVAVVLGRASFPATMVLPTNAAWVIEGTIANGSLGRRVAHTGLAFGGDSLEDFVVAGYDPALAGVLYGFAGRALTGLTTTTTASAVYTFTGTAGAGEVLVGSPGDVNGDGRPDLGTAAIGGSGSLTLLFGNAAGGYDTGPAIASAQAADMFGFGTAVSRRGLFQGASLLGGTVGADLIAGAAMYLGGDPRVSVYKGRMTPAWTTASASSPDATLAMPRSRSTTPPAVVAASWVGDADGDGFEDVVVGQREEDAIVYVH